MKDYELVIFDWDGTIMDTAVFIVKSIQATAEELQAPIPTSSAIHNTIGLNLEDMVKVLFSDVTYSRFLECYKDHSHQVAESELFAGTVETLEHLIKTDHVLAVATSKYRNELEKVLAEHDLKHLFSAIRCGDDGFPKPNARMITSILDELYVEKSGAVMVGDSEYDMLLANNAKIDSIAALYGVQAKELLMLHNPVAYIRDITELKDLTRLTK
ncbi:MAG: HAD-IA family hydrolase [Gammaproteobacteria bacterium]|nr:HAD-IA family hydrolase [Gammaproteobacteria bacterium]